MDIKALIKVCRCCGKDMEDSQFFPFCSKRCQQNDLGNWASGKYAVPCQDQSTDSLSTDEEK
jgi:endogenous inhibitor of DNA gyrase (YacG/DUF329 family)